MCIGLAFCSLYHLYINVVQRAVLELSCISLAVRSLYHLYVNVVQRAVLELCIGLAVRSLYHLYVNVVQRTVLDPWVILQSRVVVRDFIIWTFMIMFIEEIRETN